MASAAYAPLRDSSSHRSLSLNERNFLRSCAAPSSPSRAGVLRSDGRSASESRPLRLTFGRSHGAAEATVQLGPGTRAVAVVTSDLIPPPNLDRPNDGVIRFGVDLSPMANAAFGSSNPVSAGTSGGGGGGDGPSGPGGAQEEGQKLLSNRILRLLERTLIAGGAIDAEALCVRSGRWVWRLNVDVAALDDGGNLVDACVLGAAAALRHFRRPAVEMRDEEEGLGGGQPKIWHSDEREPSPLPLHHTPLCVTFALLAPASEDHPGGAEAAAAPPGAEAAVSALIDPTDREELVSDGTLTVCYNKHGELCGVDYPGGCELRPRQLVRCAEVGGAKCVELCEVLERALGEADERAVGERMERLRAAAAEAGPGGDADAAGAGRPEVPDDVPFVEATGEGDNMEVDSEGLKEIGEEQARAAREEEEYRLRALDYAKMHQAARVKDNDDKKERKGGGGPQQGSGLMSAMLRAAASSSASVSAEKTAPLPPPPSQQQRPAASSSRTAEADDEFAEFAAAAEREEEEKRAAEEEEEEGAAKKASPAAPPVVAAAAVAAATDSDEDEEVAMTLRSEFHGVGAGPGGAGPEEGGGDRAEARPKSGGKKKEAEEKKKKGKATEPDGMDVDGDDDVDDLAAAIKKKKKKRGKDKKAKKSKK